MRFLGFFLKSLFYLALFNQGSHIVIKSLFQANPIQDSKNSIIHTDSRDFSWVVQMFIASKAVLLNSALTDGVITSCLLFAIIQVDMKEFD